MFKQRFAWLVRQTWQGFRTQWPKVWQSYIVRWSVAGALLLIAWWLVGSSLPQLYTNNAPINPNDFGGMFGAASALFSALAFFAVLIALYYQRQELKDNRRSQRKQLDIAKKTACIQAYTFLAEFTYQLMKDAPDKVFAQLYKHNTGHCIDEAIELMDSIGADTKEDLRPPLFTMPDFARITLNRIKDDFHEMAQYAGPNDITTFAAQAIYKRWYESVDNWLKTFGHLQGAKELQFLLDNIALRLQEPPRNKPHAGNTNAQMEWDTYWQLRDGILPAVDLIVKRFVESDLH